MARIFFSYRRSDSQGWAGRLANDLGRAFGEVALFFDLETIRPGDDFAHAIERSLAEAEAVLVLIGPGWLSASLPGGSRRLDDPTDFVRLEVAGALERCGCVIPVLLGGARMPGAADLPRSLAGLAGRQAFELSDSRWDYDSERLFAALEQATSLKRVAGGDSDDSASIRVAEGVTLDGVEAGDIAGIKGGAEAIASPPSSIEVGKGATLRNAKIGDIVGVKVTPSKGTK